MPGFLPPCISQAVHNPLRLKRGHSGFLDMYFHNCAGQFRRYPSDIRKAAADTLLNCRAVSRILADTLGNPDFAQEFAELFFCVIMASVEFNAP